MLYYALLVNEQKVLSGPPRNLANQFAYYIDDTKGSVTFGGANCDLLGTDKRSCIDKFQFVPVTEKTYWTVTLKDVRVRELSLAYYWVRSWV